MSHGVRRRLVFFCHGFDRRRPRSIHFWQRREMRRYNARFGTDMHAGERHGDSWHITGAGLRTDFVFCDWSDIVRSRFATPSIGIAIDMVRIGLAALGQNFFARVLRRDWAIGLLLLWGFSPVILAALAIVVLVFVHPIWTLAVPPALVGVIAIARRLDARLGLVYVQHIAWAARRMALRDDPGIEAFVRHYAGTIAEAPEADEVLVVGHSIGADLALRIAEASGRAVTLLTIGQSIPLVSMQREAAPIRFAGRWLDVSARKDMLGFLAHDPSRGGAECITVNLTRAFGEDRVRSLKWHGFAMHFLYFEANRHPAPWDWLGIVAGPDRLEKRLEGARRRSGLGERRLWAARDDGPGT